MAGLRSEPSSMAVLLDLLVDGRQDLLLDLHGRLDVVDAVDHGLGLDDGQEAGLLADARVAREVLGRDLDREVRRAVVRDVDLEGRAPLGEARALGVVLLAALEEAVEARAPVLAGARADQRSQAHVDLDARDDVVRLEHVDEGLAGRVVLEERLLVEDRAGDVLVDARRREEQVAPRLAVRLRVLEADGLEALANRARRLVAGQEALAGQDHGIGGLDELVRVLFQAHLRRRGARGRALLRRERLRRHERRRRRAEGQGEDGGLHRGPAGCTKNYESRAG